MLELDFYQKSLAGLLLVCGTAMAMGSPGVDRKATGVETEGAKKRQYGTAHKGSLWAFYVVYSLVMTSEWLQSQHFNPLDRQHGVSQDLISVLQTTTLLTATLSAPLSGIIADLSGRRFACLATCLFSSLSCVLTATPYIPTLFAGRVLGGVASSLLFTAFESWMVADFQARHLESKGLDLGRAFGVIGTVNGVAAIASRVMGEWLVERMGMKGVSGVCVALLGLAALLIKTQWDENCTGATKKDFTKPEANVLETLTDRHVLALTFASAIFEGSTHVFLSSWAPVLEAARKGAAPFSYNIVFAALMASAVASSLLFTRVQAASGELLGGVLGASGTIFHVLSWSMSEENTFRFLCAFGACMGAYGPCMGVLRGRMVDDAVRARVYGFMRMLVNIFVLMSLMMVSADGEYIGMLRACAGLFHFAILGLYAARRRDAV